jgi:hypothetical protein
MPTLFQNRAAMLCAVCAVAATASRAHAGPARPCVAATLSANNNILVLNDLAYDDPDETHARRPRTSTFRVLQSYVDLNEGYRLNGPNTYYVHALWSVVFTRGDKTPMYACPYTLVTNDAEFLVLIGDFFGPTALSIYRRRDHPGRPSGGPGPDRGLLVRQIPLRDLWAPEHIPTGITDETPQWSALGTFAFSSDNRTLIHKTRWGKTLEFSLETGQVKGQ